MSARPRLSLCIPTYNRSSCLEGAVLSGLREAGGQPEGTVEILVCDNASSDGTEQMLARIQAAHPRLRVLRHPENIGFDLNYLRCVDEARGEFVWIMGDDDVWQPGAVQRVLRELDAGADACLCLAEACDLNLDPVTVLPWYLDPAPPAVWRLEGRADLIRYFNACAYNAAAFAFISVGVLRRDRFLLGRETMMGGRGFGYLHLWGMMAFFQEPLRLHYIPEVLVRNRISDLQPGAFSSSNPFGAWMHDLRCWIRLADTLFGHDPELCAAFSRIVGRNHHNTILPGLRQNAPDAAAWAEAVPLLARAGFGTVQISAVDLAYRTLTGQRLPMPALDPGTLCLVDLPLLARGALRPTVLALGGLANLIEGAGVLATLRAQYGEGRIRVYGPAECAPLLDGFDVRVVEPRRYAHDVVYREAVAGELAGHGPELVVNLDPERGIEADDLVNAALPAGALAYELPERGQDARMVKAANGAYTFLAPRGEPSALLRALGLREAAPTLWPAPPAREAARALFAQLGWDPLRTLALLGDDPALAEADAGGWQLLGLGDRAGYRALEALLGPREGRAVNLAGILEPEVTAAVLQLVGGFLGTGPLAPMAAILCPSRQGPSGNG